jgi:hypothetical protein
MGCVRICGELRKLDIRVGATTIRTLLRRHGLGPAPRRSGPTWTQFLRAQAEGIIGCDFFTVETIRLKTLFVLFFIHLSSRRVVLAGVTAHPDTAWVTQQARNVAIGLDDRGVSIGFLLRDHDAKFTRGFDDVFGSEGGQVLRTPIRAPKANAYAERLTSAWRGFGLGVLLAGTAIKKLSGSVRFAVCDPAPPPDPDADADEHEVEEDPVEQAVVFATLSEVWANSASRTSVTAASTSWTSTS